MESDSIVLNMLAENIVQPAINPQYLTYCPTMDLIAFATIDEQVHVHRLNGQKVFGVTSKQAGNKVSGLKWKPNGMANSLLLPKVGYLGSAVYIIHLLMIHPGQSLAVTFSNHTLCLTSAHTGKVMHQIDCSVHSPSQVCCLGWGFNFTDRYAVKAQLRKAGIENRLDDVLSDGAQSSILDSLSDLPLDLAFLDIEGTLPKLSVLAIGGIE